MSGGCLQHRGATTALLRDAIVPWLPGCGAGFHSAGAE